MMRKLFSIAALTSSIMGFLPAHADVTAPDGRVIECYCTDAFGKRRELGEIICITVNDRSYMAKCVMAQNVPFWRDQKMGCLSSKAVPQNFTPMPKYASYSPVLRVTRTFENH